MKQFNLGEAIMNAGMDPLGGGPLFDNLGDDEAAVVAGDISEKVLLKGHIMIICQSGEFSFTSGSGLHHCKAGSFCILVKDSFCILHSVSPDCRIALVCSQTNEFHLVASSMDRLMLFFRHFRENPILELGRDEMKDALSIYSSIKETISGRDYIYKREICHAYDLALFYILMAHVNLYQQNRVHSRQHEIYSTFLSNVSKHFREERKLEFYADLQCITPKHLSFAVKKESGISPHQWICDYVMIEARELLSGKGYSVQEVADILHFCDQSFFGKYFKAREGLSPLQYQRQPR